VKPRRKPSEWEKRYIMSTDECEGHVIAFLSDPIQSASWSTSSKAYHVDDRSFQYVAEGWKVVVKTGGLIACPPLATYR